MGSGIEALLTRTGYIIHTASTKLWMVAVAAHVLSMVPATDTLLMI